MGLNIMLNTSLMFLHTYFRVLSPLYKIINHTSQVKKIDNENYTLEQGLKKIWQALVLS
jgi:hypothetical protein